MDLTQMAQFGVRTRIISGLNSARQSTGKEVAGSGGKKAFVVTDEGIVEAGLLQPIVDSLGEEGLEYVVYDGVRPNPTVQVADRVLLAIYDLDSRVLTREEYLRELRGALDDLRAIREPAASPGSKGLAAIPRRSRRGRVAARPPRSCGTIDAR